MVFTTRDHTAAARLQPLRLDEFDALDDEAFVRAAYWRLLGRAPDPGGCGLFLERLRAGASRVEIMGDIRYSPEGARKARPVAGLRWRYVWYALLRAPGAGWLVRRWRQLKQDRATESMPASVAVASRSGNLEDAYFDGVLAFNDGDFVAQAYRDYLGREPDESGHRSYVARLHCGEARAGVLRSIRASPEARRRGSDARMIQRPSGLVTDVLAASPASRDICRPVIQGMIPDKVGESGGGATVLPETGQSGNAPTRDRLLKAAGKWAAGPRRIPRVAD